MRQQTKNLIKYLFPSFTRLALLALCVSATGCFPYHATTRMGVSGKVTDAMTLAPLGGARVSFKDGGSNEAPVVLSAADGSFNLPKQKQWQIRFVVGDYLKPFGGTVYVRHDGYATNEINVQPEDENHHFRTTAELDSIPLKPLSQTH